MKFSELIEAAIACIESFNPVIKTIDSHSDDFIKDVHRYIALIIVVKRSI
jgi:hypothetical protein